MPGVLMVEAMAQLSGVLCLQAPVSDGKGLFFFAGACACSLSACGHTSVASVQFWFGMLPPLVSPSHSI